jgi:uncharacterized SAM-binding protein YcdF (DUF218 family)
MAVVTIDSREYWMVSKRACGIRVLGGIGAAVLAFVVLWLTRTLWLTALAIFLTRGEALRKSDALIVLSGGPGDRARRGAQLFEQGYAPVVLTAGEEHIPGTPAFDAEYEMGLLESFGIPAENIATLGILSSTNEKAERSRDWLLSHNLRSLSVISDPFHLRRVSFIFGSIFRGTEMDVSYVSTEPSWFDPQNWWQRDAELDAVFSEYIKMANTMAQLVREAVSR